VRDAYRLSCHFGRIGGTIRYVGHGFRNLRNRATRAGDLTGLGLTGLGQFASHVLGLAHRTANLICSAVDRTNKISQGIDGVVHRIGNSTGNILGNGCVRRQITVCQVGHFVQQAQNGALITFILLARFVQAGL